MEFINRYYFVAMQLTGMCLFLTLFFRGSKLVRTDWNKVAAFFGFAVFIEIIRMGLMDSDPSFKIEPDYPGTGLANMIWVFWEDMLFVMPIYFVKDYLKLNKNIWMPVVIISSLIFGSLHVYQGYVAAIVLSIYPFFLSYRYGIRNGFGTVMVCHIMYDAVTHLGYKIMCLIKIMEVSLN